MKHLACLALFAGLASSSLLADSNKNKGNNSGVGFYSERENLPPGLAKRGGALPPGLQKHLERSGRLPPGLEKRRSGMSYRERGLDGGIFVDRDGDGIDDREHRRLRRQQRLDNQHVYRDLYRNYDYRTQKRSYQKGRRIR